MNTIRRPFFGIKEANSFLNLASISSPVRNISKILSISILAISLTAVSTNSFPVSIATLLTFVLMLKAVVDILLDKETICFQTLKITIKHQLFFYSHI